MPYAGDVSCKECWNTLQGNPQAQLVDVRTSAEWSFVGVPDLSSIGKETLLTQWQLFPSMQVNADFVTHVTGLLSGLGGDAASPLYLLCRSGVRSIAAAEALCAQGYEAFNVTGGFEGNMNGDGHRGTVAGWKFDGLPWRQS